MRYFTIAFAFLLVACQSAETEKKITIGNTYSVSIPGHLDKTDDLNDDASLQYQNLWKELYVIVIDEPKDEFNELMEIEGGFLGYEANFQGYSDLILDGFDEAIDLKAPFVVKDTVINGMNAKFTAQSAYFEGMDIYYQIGIYEGKENYFQMFTWTSEGKKEKLKNQMNKMMVSIKELGTSAQ